MTFLRYNSAEEQARYRELDAGLLRIARTIPPGVASEIYEVETEHAVSNIDSMRITLDFQGRREGFDISDRSVRALYGREAGHDLMDIIRQRWTHACLDVMTRALISSLTQLRRQRDQTAEFAATIQSIQRDWDYYASEVELHIGRRDDRGLTALPAINQVFAAFCRRARDEAGLAIGDQTLATAVRAIQEARANSEPPRQFMAVDFARAEEMGVAQAYETVQIYNEEGRPIVLPLWSGDDAIDAAAYALGIRDGRRTFAEQYEGTFIAENPCAEIPATTIRRRREMPVRRSVTVEGYAYDADQGDKYRTAAQTGRKLLYDNLDEQQRQDFRDYGMFAVKGGITGDVYFVAFESNYNVVITGRPDVTVKEVVKSQAPVHRCCFLPGMKLCYGDMFLAQKYYIEHFEEEALSEANGSGGCAPLRVMMALYTRARDAYWPGDCWTGEIK